MLGTCCTYPPQGHHRARRWLWRQRLQQSRTGHPQPGHIGSLGYTGGHSSQCLPAAAHQLGLDIPHGPDGRQKNLFEICGCINPFNCILIKRLYVSKMQARITRMSELGTKAEFCPHPGSIHHNAGFAQALPTQMQPIMQLDIRAINVLWAFSKRQVASSSSPSWNHIQPILEQCNCIRNNS